MDSTARDIQAWEYVPLGPFLGKCFGIITILYEIHCCNYEVTCEEEAKRRYSGTKTKTFEESTKTASIRRIQQGRYSVSAPAHHKKRVLINSLYGVSTAYPYAVLTAVTSEDNSKYGPEFTLLPDEVLGKLTRQTQKKMERETNNKRKNEVAEDDDTDEKTTRKGRKLGVVDVSKHVEYINTRKTPAVWNDVTQQLEELKQRAEELRHLVDEL
ncbi:zinc finger, PHD-type containing protein [Tanacetum coccineum]